ncbi:unnamed protein product, partial [Iphiclides podalirius]
MSKLSLKNIFEKLYEGHVGALEMSAAAQTLYAASVRAQASAVPEPAPSAFSHARGKHTVHWFRKGLRLHDNPSLREGLTDAVTFRCIFIIDPWFASSSNVGINKWRFLLECLEDLDSSLRKLNSRLFVVRGQPNDALPRLFREWGTTALSFEEDPEPYGRVRDHNITTKCRDIGVTVISRVSHTLYKLDKIIERNGGKAPLTYHQFQALVAGMPPPPPAEPPISAQTLNGAFTPLGEDHEERFGVPTLEELGFDTEDLKSPVWIGGESEALMRLERHLERKAWVASFGRPKMTPQSLLASPTGLSPYLRFGCLSPRLFYYQLTALYKRVKGVQPPLSLHGQILWREFFYCAATRNPNFDRMVGNPICVQIPWVKNQDALSKWANGQTGFPWIDSIMIQLREEGWIHHLARHAVACFLTRGDLWISWEEGMKVFDELLLDADWSVNAGTWMWLSCSSFFQQFFHCYCPVRFGRKTDPNGDFIRRYIPVLRNMPTRYIHEPWVAPEAVQQSAGCVVGRDYPLPMIDHTKASQVNIERIKQVYAQLAKYKPQSSLNPQAVARPNITQSSPSPTSIIKSINQSNYLCSRTPDSQLTLTPSQQPPFKTGTNISLRPGNSERDTKQQYTHIVIVEQGQNTNMSSETPQGLPTHDKKGQPEISNDLNPIKQNYDLKNLIIKNSDPQNSQQAFHGQPCKIDKLAQPVQIDNYASDKSEFHMQLYKDNETQERNTNTMSDLYVPNQPNRETINESVTENNENLQNMVISTNNLNSDQSNKEDPPDN